MLPKGPDSFANCGDMKTNVGLENIKNWAKH